MTELYSDDPGECRYAVIIQEVASGQEISKEVAVGDVTQYSRDYLEVTEPDPEAEGGSVVHRQVTSIRFINH